MSVCHCICMCVFLFVFLHVKTWHTAHIFSLYPAILLYMDQDRTKCCVCQFACSMLHVMYHRVLKIQCYTIYNEKKTASSCHIDTSNVLHHLGVCMRTNVSKEFAVPSLYNATQLLLLFLFHACCVFTCFRYRFNFM